MNPRLMKQQSIVLPLYHGATLFNCGNMNINMTIKKMKPESYSESNQTSKMKKLHLSCFTGFQKLYLNEKFKTITNVVCLQNIQNIRKYALLRNLDFLLLASSDEASLYRTESRDPLRLLYNLSLLYCFFFLVIHQLLVFF